MELTRTLKKGTQRVELTLSIGKGDDPRDALHEFCNKLQRQLKAGFTVTPIRDPVAAAKPLLAMKDIGLETLLEAFPPEEREAIVERQVAAAEKAGRVIGIDRSGYAGADVFAKCPSRTLLHHLLEGMLAEKIHYKYDTGSLNGDLTFYATAISNAARDPARAGWIAEEIEQAIGKAEPVLRKWLQARAGKFRSQKKVTAQLATGAKAGEKAEDELLEAIGKAPDDDAPRLVWADWLLEHGIKWGEVVQRQCELERMKAGSPGWKEKYDASWKMQTSTISKFLAPIRPFLAEYSVERGLIDRLTVSMDKLLKPGAAAAIVLRAPAAYLKVQGLKPDQAAAIAKLPRGRFRALDIAGRMPAAALEALLRSPLLDGLGEVTLRGVDAKTVGALAAMPASVKDVCLWDCPVAGAAIDALAKSPAGKKLVELALPGKSSLDAAAVDKLKSLPALSAQARAELKPKKA